MTRDEILNIPAGREMDALIATHFTKFEHYQGEWWWQDGTLDELPDYSTDIGAAWWGVVEKFPEVHMEHRGINDFCMIGDDFDTVAICPTMAEAICKAALLAVMK